MEKNEQQDMPPLSISNIEKKGKNDLFK